MRKAIVLLALGLCASAAWADYTFPAFSPGNVPSTWNGILTGNAPADTYIGYEVLLDWTAVSGNPYSSEARLHFGTAVATGGNANPPAGAGTTYMATHATPTNGLSNANPVTNLRFAGNFAAAWDGSAPMAFNYRQSWSGSVADWQNVRITMKTLVTPTATDLGTVSGPLNVGGSLAAGEIKWYKFTLTQDAADALDTFLDIDTEGSLLTTGNDTEIAIYSASGAYITTDDDDGSGLLSQLTFGDVGPRPAVGDGTAYNGRDGALVAGTYYLAVGGYNSAFSNFFGATSASTYTGTFALNFNTNIPEPASLALIALGALVLIRRR